MATKTCANHNLTLNAFHRSMVSQRARTVPRQLNAIYSSLEASRSTEVPLSVAHTQTHTETQETPSPRQGALERSAQFVLPLKSSKTTCREEHCPWLCSTAKESCSRLCTPPRPASLHCGSSPHNLRPWGLFNSLEAARKIEMPEA